MSDKTYEVDVNGDKLQMRVLTEIEGGTKVIAFLDNLDYDQARGLAFSLLNGSYKLPPPGEKT